MTGHVSTEAAGRDRTSTHQVPRAIGAVRVATLCGALLLIAAWGAKPWEWSLVDDPDYRINLLSAQQAQGWLGGVLDRIRAGYEYDRAGGQFRPFLWFYSAVFYLVGPGIAHALRLAMLVFAVGGVAYAARTRLGMPTSGRIWMLCLWAAAAVLSIRGVFDGLSFLSIMELPTIAFAVAAVVDRHPSRRLLWLTLAATCKSPVVGGVFALAIVFYRQGRRLHALAATLVAVVIVLSAREFASDGSYTADYTLTVDHAVDTLMGLARQLALPCLVLGSALAWTRTWRLRWDSDAFVLGAAGGGYVVLLLPWGSSSGYNLAAPAFLLVASAVLVIARTLSDRPFMRPAPRGEASSERLRSSLSLLPLLVALVVGGFVTFIGVTAALDRDATIRGVADWTEDLPAGDVVATNGIESSDRYRQILSLRDPTGPTHQFVYAAPDQPVPCGVRWLVVMNDQGQPTADQQLRAVRAFPTGTVYRVADSAGPSSVC